MNDEGRQELAALQRGLRKSLRSLDEDLALILEGEDSVESEDFLVRFEEQTAGLSSLLHDMHTVLEEMHEVGPLNLTSAVKRALDQVVEEVKNPMVVQTDWAVAMPNVVVARGPMAAVLHRVLKVAIEFSGVGGEMRVTTACEGRHATLGILAQRVGLPLERRNQDPIELRCASVADFVRSIGGEFEAEVSRDGSLFVRLQMELAVEAC